MRLSRCQIKGLFGQFNHDFPINTSSRITILHGPNGVGKTTVLKLIHDLFAQNFPAVSKVPFESLSIWTIQPRGRLTVHRSGRGEKKPSLQIDFKATGEDIKTFKFEEKEDDSARQYRFFSNDLADMIDCLERVSPTSWYDSSQGDVLTFEEALYRYRANLPQFMVDRYFKRQSTAIHNVLSSVSIHFIQTQRLTLPKRPTRKYKHSAYSSSSSVQMYAEELAESLQHHLRESGSKAASLDRTFPHRVLAPTVPPRSDDTTIRNDLAEQAKYRSRLMDAGLIDAEDEVAVEKNVLEEYERKVLRYYLDDVQQKFSVFEKLLPKIELFMDIINSRFLHKRLSVDRIKGFVFTSDNKDEVPLHLLSSGEQHEIVLAYELLFKVERGSLILIDEPEISLHVSWQHSFLEDLGRISALTDLDFIIATHSPSIIHQHQDLMVPLGTHQ